MALTADWTAPDAIERSDRMAAWRSRNTVPPWEMGRCYRPEDMIAKHGEHAVRPILDAYETADDLALEVLLDFTEMPGMSGRRMYQQALVQGIHTVDDPPESMVRLFEQFDNPPEWVDFDQLRRGSIAYFRGGPLVSFALTCSVIAGSAYAYGITRPVVFSNRFVENAYVRAKETTRWIVAACQPGGMERWSPGFALTGHVRLMHAMVRKSCTNNANWDWNDWGMPLADADGCYTINYDFTQAMIEPLQDVGIRFSDQEIEDIYALWRYIGYVLGVPQHLLPRGPEHARQMAEIYLAMDPGADDECRALVKMLIELTTAPDSDIDLDVFPDFVTKLFPPLRLRKLLYGFTRYWNGQEWADGLDVPNTWHKHLPLAAKPISRAMNLGRRVGLLDDEKMAWATLDLLSDAAKPEGEETTLAQVHDVEAGIARSGAQFTGARGRTVRSAKRLADQAR